MIARIVSLSAKNPLYIGLLVVVLGLWGYRSFRALPIDAVPDVTSVQVQVLTAAIGLSPLEVESLVTRPIEATMSGLPGAERVRSISRTGVSAVTIVFNDDVDLERARELVAQRLPQAREAIAPGAGRPQMGPLSTGLGEIYHFTMKWPGHTAAELRTLLDWEISFPLRSVPGVVEVNGWGGDQREIEVALRPFDLRALGISQEEVERALLGGGSNAGGGAIVRGEEQILVRLDAQYRSAEDVMSQVVRRGVHGTPVFVRDVATVRDSVAPRVAAATADGEGPTQYAMVQMIAGGNAHDVVARVKEKLAELQARMPEGVKIEPFYDRSDFVERVLGTVFRSLLEGGAVVALVLLAFLGDLRAGLIVASVIPLAMLGAFGLMQAAHLTGNLMSLGAIDFGLVVDGAVVLMEGTLATMAAKRISAHEALIVDAKKHGRSVAFGVLIIALVYVPVLLLEGVEGKMFRPMGLTVLFALGIAFVLTFTWVPAMGAWLLRKSPVTEPWPVRVLRPVYEATLARAMKWPSGALALMLALWGLGIGVVTQLGADFVPRLLEGDLIVQLTRPPSVSVAEAERGTTTVEQVLLRFPQVKRVVSRTGSPDVATDVMGIEQSDIFVLLHPKEQWGGKSRDELLMMFDEALRKELPGSALAFTQPIEMRVSELLGGVKSDIGVKIFGDDLVVLRELGRQVSGTLQKIPGAVDVRAEPTEGLPLISLRPNPVQAGRVGVTTAELTGIVEAMRQGRSVGQIAEGNRRFPITVRYETPPSSESAELGQLVLPLGRSETVLLGDVADIAVEDAPAQLSREQGRRRLLVEANVRGRDLGGFAEEAQARLKAFRLPPGYFFEFSGQYENLVRAAERLMIVVPATVLGIFALLYLTFSRARPSLLILLNIPAAASGGIVALWLRGLDFSVSAAVGLIALFGVATMNGVVLLSAILEHEHEGHASAEAALLGAKERLRPVLTTAVVASIGFLPMALATGTGAEVQRPLATCVMGGLLTATLVTLVILPVLWAGQGRKKS